MDNLNTIRKTRFDLELVKSYLRGTNEKRAVHDIPPHELDPYLASFIASVKKKNGEDFEPGTLRGILGSVDRYFRKHNYGHAIFSGNVRDFPRTRDALSSKQKQLKREGRGNHPNRAQPITSEEVEVLYLTGQLGTGTPDALLNTVWFNNWVYFGLRGMKVHRHLRWSDILLARLESGAEYLEYMNGQSKPFRPRVYAMPEQPDRDPVAVYKLYMSKRPRPMLSADAPFYLAPNSRKPNYSDAWFKCQAAGENRLGRLMKTMVINAGLPEKKRIAYKSITGHLGKTGELEQQSSSSSSSSSLQNGLSHLSEKNPLPLSMYSLMSAESSLQVSCSSRQISGEISSISAVSLETLDAATKQLWHHYKTRGGFSNDQEFMLHLLQREQSCRECTNRNSSSHSDINIWHQKGRQAASAEYDGLRESHESSSNHSAKHTWNDTGHRKHAKDEPNNSSVTVSEAVMLFREWLQEKNLASDFEKFNKSELNDLLGQYYQDVSEEYGIEYKWVALDAIRSALEKHLSSPACSQPMDIVHDTEFKSSNDILQSFVKRRRFDDCDDKSQISSVVSKVSEHLEGESQVITTEDLFKIHTSPLLTTDNPEGLLHKVWFDVCLYLGVGCGENPPKGSLIVKTDCDGVDYYCFEGDASDTSMRLYSSTGANCPVIALKQYLAKTHPDQDLLFQHPKPEWCPEQETWYSQEPMSRDDLESIADFLLRSTELSHCYSLVALQATSDWVQHLNEMGKDRLSMIQLTGLQVSNYSGSEVVKEVSKDLDVNCTVTRPESISDQEELQKKLMRPTSNSSKPPNTQPMMLLPTDHFSSFVQSSMSLGSMLLPSVGGSGVPPAMLLPVSFQDPNLPAVMYLKPEQSKHHRSQDYRGDANISINCVTHADHAT